MLYFAKCWSLQVLTLRRLLIWKSQFFNYTVVAQILSLILFIYLFISISVLTNYRVPCVKNDHSKEVISGYERFMLLTFFPVQDTMNRAEACSCYWFLLKNHVGIIGARRYLWFFPFSFYRIAWGICDDKNAILTEYTKHELVTYKRHHFKSTPTLREDRTAAAKAL